MSSHILHIANDYAGSRVYSQLLGAIDTQGIRQTVFTTIRTKEQYGRNAIEFITSGSTIHYADNWCLSHRFFFGLKAKSNYEQLLRLIDPNTITHIYAHTLFSDGVLALMLHKEFGIPYTVTIRNTDINVFMRFMIHTWRLGNAILQKANKIICISPAHITRVKLWGAWHDDFSAKLINIPNGVNSYWLEHMSCDLRRYKYGSTCHLLYIGNFTHNKNVPRLMKAVLSLKKKGLNLQLHIIGGNGRDVDRIKTIAIAHPETFHLYGIVQDKEHIRSVMRHCHLFVMPSLTETFGLVYVEALSQGLPILYTVGEGVDGFFSSSFGERCNPRSVEDIANKIELMMAQYDAYNINGEYLWANFDWNKVARKYLETMGLQSDL